MAVQRGRSKRGGEKGPYSVRYVEPPSAPRTKLADFSNILLGNRELEESLDAPSNTQFN